MIIVANYLSLAFHTLKGSEDYTLTNMLIRASLQMPQGAHREARARSQRVRLPLI